MIDKLSTTQRINFLRQISSKKFVEISCDEKGTYVLQMIFKAAKEPSEFELIRATLLHEDNFLKLSKDIKGHHMIMLIIRNFPDSIRNELFHNIMLKFQQLARNKHGLCVMKELIIYSQNDAEKQKAVVERLLDDVIAYAEDEYGNYVMQHVFKYF